MESFVVLPSGLDSYLSLPGSVVMSAGCNLIGLMIGILMENGMGYSPQTRLLS